jgi:tetratricopeptide (TPR) repeat protein
MDEYISAIEHYKLALEMRKLLFPGDREDVAQSYYNLGLVYYDMKDNNSAIEHQKLALEMRRRLFPEDHHDVVI